MYSRVFLLQTLHLVPEGHYGINLYLCISIFSGMYSHLKLVIKHFVWNQMLSDSSEWGYFLFQQYAAIEKLERHLLDFSRFWLLVSPFWSGHFELYHWKIFPYLVSISLLESCLISVSLILKYKGNGGNWRLFHPLINEGTFFFQIWPKIKIADCRFSASEHLMNIKSMGFQFKTFTSDINKKNRS